MSDHPFDAIIKPFDLNQSPFYQAWSNGTLPESALVQYAAEYGNFIKSLPIAWETLNDDETAHEEEEHAEEWEVFAEALGTKYAPVELPEIKALMETTNELFSKKATAIGALYAFEKQQPSTSESKLKGLREHFPHAVKGEKYFITHSSNHHEAEKLQKLIATLNPVERKEAEAACSKMSKALWDALDGIYNAHSNESCCVM